MRALSKLAEAAERDPECVQAGFEPVLTASANGDARATDLRPLGAFAHEHPAEVATVATTLAEIVRESSTADADD